MTNGASDQIGEQRGYLRATFHLLPTQSGGRKMPITREYRPNWSIGSEPDAQHMSGAPLLIDSGETVAPGEGAEVRLFPMYPDFWTSVTPGTQLFAFEGLRLVGRAVVTAVIPPLARPDVSG
jgi:hypothetical protein